MLHQLRPSLLLATSRSTFATNSVVRLSVAARKTLHVIMTLGLLLGRCSGESVR